MTFEQAVEIELEGETTLFEVSQQPVFPYVVKHQLTDKYMRRLVEQSQKLDPPPEILELSRVAFAEGAAVGVLMCRGQNGSESEGHREPGGREPRGCGESSRRGRDSGGAGGTDHILATATSDDIVATRARLSEWEALLHVVPGGAEDPDDIARRIAKLRAVAEAAKALAALENWFLAADGHWYHAVYAHAFSARKELAEALLDLGSVWDWRAK